MSVIDDSDPTRWSDEKLEAHARKWVGLGVMQPGPIPDPVIEPDDEDAPLGEVLGVVGAGVCFAALGFALLFGFAVSLS